MDLQLDGAPQVCCIIWEASLQGCCHFRLLQRFLLKNNETALSACVGAGSYSLVFLPVCVCRQYSVGFEMVTVSTVGDPGAAAFQKKSSGDYRYRHKH